jgi:hypothetical protein
MATGLGERSPVSPRRAGLDYQEIKSHSSLLSNERVAILFYMLDTASINLNESYTYSNMIRVKSILYQIYKNVRALIRANVSVRNALGLDTRQPGIYITDVIFTKIEEMNHFCMMDPDGFTIDRVFKITQHLNSLEMLIRDIMQYFSYFFRPEIKHKPDIEVATEKYKEMADKMTLDQLRGIVGKYNKIDFEHLGISHGKGEEEDASLTTTSRYA